MHKKKILFLTHHWKNNSHHSTYSGYQALVEYAKDNYDCSVVTWGHDNKVSSENGVTVHYVKPLFRRDFFFSKRLAISHYAKKIQNQYHIVHALYTDCGFFQLHPNFYSTLHVTPYVAQKVNITYLLFLFLKNIFIEKRVIRNSKKVFVVSKNLIPVKYKNLSKFIFVPHGVNTDYWSPEDTINSKGEHGKYQNNFVLCVGNHGLNKKLLCEAIRDNGNIYFVVLGLHDFHHNFKNLKILHNISDDELKSLYMNCSLFIRPMNFTTANNSILDALSMGCRVLISSPDISCDYVQPGIDDDCFKEVNSHKLLGELKLFLQKSDRSKAEIIRKYSIENFDWKVVWRMIDAIYKKNIYL